MEQQLTGGQPDPLEHGAMANAGQPRKPPSKPSSICRAPSSSPSPSESQPQNVVPISLHDVDPVSIRLDRLCVSVDESPDSLRALLSRTKSTVPPGQGHGKTILDNVSADIKAGTLTAILGGSGSGKTSLLNVMSGRMRGRRISVSGRTLFNGSEDITTVRSAYVIQQDLLLPTLTVRETLTYAAQLRLPPYITKAERQRLVEEVILQLGLKEAANTRIGNHEHRGCSGGEKRRTSIGVQLLSNPSVLFLDEPTTGLDSTSAFQVMKMLHGLAQRGMTIVTTIHQPRSEIWGLFDNLILLAKGQPAYAASATQCIDYFQSLGYTLPEFVNPAEHLIDVVSVDTRNVEVEQSNLARLNHIVSAWRARESEEKEFNDVSGGRPVLPVPGALRPHRSTFFQQVTVLTARTWIVTIRDPMGMIGSLIEAFTMGIIMGWIFLDADGSQAGIRTRQGALYTAAALQGFLILLYETYRLTIDIQLFDEEKRQGVVGVPAFLISRRLARLFVEDVPVPLIFSLIFYFMTGFRNDGPQFMTFFAVILLEQYIAVCFATTCVAIVRHFAGASLVANLAYTLQSMACGYFVQANSIPIYLRWTKWIAYVFYAFGALCANEFVGHFYDCPAPGGPANPACKEYTGSYIMQSLGFPGNWVWRPIIALLGFVLAFYLGAGILLRFWTVDIGMARARPMSHDESAGKEKMAVRQNQARTVAIRLDDFALNIEKHSLRGRTTKEIVRPLTTDFQPGTLNVILGPSGSGKTSLLNAMAGRLKDDTTTKYRTSGSMTFNGLIPSEKVVHSICSFVTQDDDALLPSLTVRETLRFAAGLRLPKWMSKQQKLQRTEEIILKMGLKDCADHLIGSDLVKGISGGEKRRVTIAVQILTEPKVLFLDEPLSGLDAFTASSIMDVLEGLANEGRTLVVTIHQPRSDLFSHFGSILLLARGGYPVYAGPGRDMLTHFASQGHHCARHVNPADFALDLITVDLQHEEREAATRAKVLALIESWTPDQLVRATTPSVSTPAELGSLARDRATFRSSFPILVRRAALNIFRQPQALLARTMQVIGLGIVLALFFAPLKNDYYAVQTRAGFVAEIAPLYFVGMLNNVAIYPAEREVFYRDYDDRVYSVEAFFLTYTALEVPFEVVSAIVFAVLADLACGLERTASMFFIVMFNAFCVTNVGESVGIAFNTLFDHTGFSVNIMCVLLSVASIMGGIISLNVPPFLRALNYLSPIKYQTANLAAYTLRGVHFTCEDWQRLPGGQCPITTGKEVLQLYDLDVNAGLHLMALGICTVVYRVLAWLVLKCVKERWLGRFWRWVDWRKRRNSRRIEGAQISNSS